MGFLLDLYPQCLDSFELLKIAPELPEAKSDTELAVIAQLKQLPGVTYEHHQALKERGWRRSDLALKKWLSQGAYIGMGFRSIDDLGPRVIPRHEWCSLAIDYKNSRAFCTGREYTGVRFMNARMLRELPNDQIELINKAVKGEPQAEAFGNIDSGDDVTSQKLDAEELSINSIMNYWFRYEPKEETRTAKLKCNYEKKRIRGLLKNAVDTKRLKTRVETKETKTDVFPNEITRKFSTELEDKRYRGLAYTRVDIVKIAYVPLNDLAQYLLSINETPPKDSPLMTKWLAKWWSDDEPQHVEEVGDGGGSAIKKRKILKPKEKDATEGLLLVYEITGFYNVKYLDEMPGLKAWGKIVSKEFKSELIEDHTVNKKNIMLSGGDKLERGDFLEKYRKRFEFE